MDFQLTEEQESLQNAARNFCRKHKRILYLANNVKLAIKYNLDGVYIPSFNKDLKINYFTKKKKFETIGSAHNILQIRQKERQRSR